MRKFVFFIDFLSFLEYFIHLFFFNRIPNRRKVMLLGEGLVGIYGRSIINHLLLSGNIPE